MFGRRRLIRPTWALLRSAVDKSRKDRVSMVAQALACPLPRDPCGGARGTRSLSIVADDDAIQSLVRRAETIVPTEAVLLGDSLERSARSTGSARHPDDRSGLALALWTTSSLPLHLMEGVTRVFGGEDERSFLRRRLLALLIVLALVVSARLSWSPRCARTARRALGRIRAPCGANDRVGVVDSPVAVRSWPRLCSRSGLCCKCPDVHGQSLEHVLPGAAVAMVIWLIGSGVFAVYAASLGSYNKSWGTLSAVVITLIWLWLTSAALLCGAEVNAEAGRRRRSDPRPPTAPAVTPRAPGVRQPLFGHVSESLSSALRARARTRREDRCEATPAPRSRYETWGPPGGRLHARPGPHFPCAHDAHAARVIERHECTPTPRRAVGAGPAGGADLDTSGASRLKRLRRCDGDTDRREHSSRSTGGVRLRSGSPALQRQRKGLGRYVPSSLPPLLRLGYATHAVSRTTDPISDAA